MATAFEKSDGNSLNADEVNRMSRGVLRDGQTIDGGVSLNDPVWFDQSSSSWKQADATTVMPQGVYTDATEDIVTMNGYVDSLSGLTAGSVYYMATGGGLTTDVTDTFIGLAVSTTELFINIQGRGVQLAETKVVSASSSFTFSNLSGKRYRLVFSCSRSGALTLRMRVNGLSTSTYDYTRLQGVGGAAGSSSSSGQTQWDIHTSSAGDMHGEVTITLGGTAASEHVGFVSNIISNGSRLEVAGGFNTTNSTSITSLTILTSANDVTGTFSLYKLQ